MKLTIEVEEDKEHETLLRVQCLMMRESIESASELIEDMINYGPDPWDRTEAELKDVLDLLNVFLVDDK